MLPFYPGVASENDFQWLAQLRYYWEENRCRIRIINAAVFYANEYLGNSGRYVSMKKYVIIQWQWTDRQIHSFDGENIHCKIVQFWK